MYKLLGHMGPNPILWHHHNIPYHHHHHHHHQKKKQPPHLNTPNTSMYNSKTEIEGKTEKMGDSCSETESPVFVKKKTMNKSSISKERKRGVEEERWPRKNKVTLEGYIESSDNSSDQGSENSGIVGRTKSLTDEDLEDLKGCLDLGFGFNYDEIPELCNTLPALELCYSMSQRFILDDQQQRSPDSSSVDESVNSASSSSSSSSSSMVANWKISSPGDHPDEVKARLKYWAQAVACTVRLCS